MREFLKNLAIIVLFIAWLFAVFSVLGGCSERQPTAFEKREHVTSTPG